MHYVIETLEIERERVARAIRDFEMRPEQDERSEARELILRHRKRVLEEAVETLRDPSAVERELDPALDVEYPVEVLRGERARLLEVNRSLEAALDPSGSASPEERAQRNRQRVREIEEWLPVLGERLDRRSRIGFS